MLLGSVSGTKSLWIFASRANLINGGTEPTPSEISRNYPKLKAISGNSFLFLGVKRFCPDLIPNHLNFNLSDHSSRSGGS